MKDALHFIVSKIVTNPDAVEIAEGEADGIVSFTITVAKEDMGKIIGKDGRVIRAIRNVLKIPAIKENKRINIALQEVA